MSLSAILSTFAEAGATRYAYLCQQWQTIFDLSLNDKHFGYADHPGNTAKRCFEVAERYLADERDNIDTVIEEVAGKAHQTTLRELLSNDSAELPDAALDHLSVTAQYIADELVAQIHRDIAMVRQAVQRSQLDVHTISRAKRIPARQALIEHRIDNHEHLNFMFHDRFARKWSSKKFVRALWRHTLLSVYNETVMLALADHGLATAAIIGENGVEEIIGLAGGSELNAYADVRTDHFHPNSNAYLAMVPSDV